MAERQKLVYIAVEDKQLEVKQRPFSYTQVLLQNTLQVMGCRPRHAFKMSKHVFEILRKKKVLSMEFSKHLSDVETECDAGRCVNNLKQIGEEHEPHFSRKLSNYQNKQATITIHREQFLDVLCDVLTAYRYVGPTQRADLTLASRIQERKVSLTILLCGTSGCGKSTLSTLLASRLGFTTVVSTDSIRHVMRSFVNERGNPLLWCSTYDAGECLDPVAAAEAKANKKARKMASISGHDTVESLFGILQEDNGYDECLQHHSHESTKPKIKTEYKDLSAYKGNVSCEDEKIMSSRMMAVQGYKAQSEIVIDSVDRLITIWEKNYESVIVEGVHLSLSSVLLDECSVSSDEEFEESNLADSGDDLGSTGRNLEEDGLQGSVDDQSCGSDDDGEELGPTTADDSDQYCSDNSVHTCGIIRTLNTSGRIFSPGETHLRRAEYEFFRVVLATGKCIGQ